MEIKLIAKLLAVKTQAKKKGRKLLMPRPGKRS